MPNPVFGGFFTGNGGGSLVTSVFGRTGAVTAQAGDYSADQVDLAATPLIAGAAEVEAALLAVAQSPYALTVFVAQGHAYATDDRTDLALGDMLHPFATLTAACAAISAAALGSPVALLVAAGNYDESVTVPPNVFIFGQGRTTVIRQLVFSGSGRMGAARVRVLNDVAGGSINDMTAVRAISGARVNLFGCDIESVNSFALVQSGGAAASASSCRLVSGGTASAGVVIVAPAEDVEFVGCKIVCVTSANGIVMAFNIAGGSVNRLRISGCELSIVATNPAFNGNLSGIVAETISASGSVFVDGCSFHLECTDLAATPTWQVLGVESNFTGFAGTLFISNVSVSTGPNQTNIGGGVVTDINGGTSTLRMLNIVWLDQSVEPPRRGNTLAGGVYVHEGVLTDGTRF